jgi:hypothetical protein
MSKILEIGIASTFFCFFHFVFAFAFATYFGGLLQSLIISQVVFGTCFLIVAFYIVTKKG